MKILILMMSCHTDLYENQAKYMYEALLSSISKLKLEDIITLKVYYGNSQNVYEDNNIIYLKSGDNFSNTYYKTLEAFEYVSNNYEYDFLLRINCSTYINIQLLYNICKYLKENNITDVSYTHELLYLPNSVFAPNIYNFHLIGKMMLFSKETINLILDNKFIFMDNDEYPNAGIRIENGKKIIAYQDDIAISAVINTYNLNNNNDAHPYMTAFLSIPMFNETFHTFEYCKNFLSIVVKDSNNKNDQKINQILSLQKMFNDNVIHDDEIKNILKINIKYSCNPKVYIGFFNNKHNYVYKNKIIKYIKSKNK